MLPKKFLSVVIGSFLGVSGVLAAEQKEAEVHFINAYQRLDAQIAAMDAAIEDPDEDEDFIAVRLFAEPNYQGTHCSINWEYLRDGQCVNLPNRTKVSSVTVSAAIGCCLLYRSPCPAEPFTEYHHQSPGFYHQKVFGQVGDLSPYGFTPRPKSVICPPTDFCKGFVLDRNWSPEGSINLAPFWVDYRSIPERRHL